MRAGFDGLGSFPRFEDFFDELFERFRDREFWRVYDDVEPALAELKRRGLKLGVISNFDSRLYDVLRACRLDHFFDSIFHLDSCRRRQTRPGDLSSRIESLRD